jgi:Ca-activated chloride channel family protein
VGLQGYAVPPEERADVVLTFVIDVSGSMDMENRLELVKDALWLLVQELRPTDRVGIVVYGSRAYTVLEHTPVEKGRRITRAIDRLRPEGSTNAEGGLTLAYELAREAFDPEAVNRVILCSDGVANVGSTGPDAILERIRAYAEQEIYLTTVGFGMGNYNDVLMEQLADNGDGFYAYVDTLKEAERVFVHDLTSTLQVIARDAKVQVDFNPAVVSRYRLLGYENRDVADEDFRNDAVDAGEIGPGHSVTALYEVKFHPEAPAHEAALTVHMRYEAPDTGEVRELSRALAQADFALAFEDAPIRFQLDAVVAEYAEILRHSYWAQDSSLEDVALEAARLAEYLPQDEEVAEFADLARRASGLTDVVTE